MRRSETPTIRSWGVLLALSLAGCGAEDWGPDAISHGTTNDPQIALGREKYELYCSGCHGVQGDAQGPAAIHLAPKPRDFRTGRIKFALVSSGKKARDDDYLRVITNGLKGTAMPAFPLIPLEERRAIVAYLRTFDENPGQPGEGLAIPKDPYAGKEDKAIAAGEVLYHGMAQCHTCHPAYADQPTITAHMKSSGLTVTSFRDNMYRSEMKDSDWGVPIKPPDFLVDNIKTGYLAEDVVRVVAAGVGGTAMPTWSEVLDGKQLWALAHYVAWLADLRDTDEGRALRARLDAQETP